MILFLCDALDDPDRQAMNGPVSRNLYTPIF